MAKYRITNISNGPRFFNSPAGTVTLDPAKSSTADFDSDDGDLKRIKGRGDFAVVEIAADEEGTDLFKDEVHDEFTNMSDKQLRDFLKERDGKSPAMNSKRSTLLAHARE